MEATCHRRGHFCSRCLSKVPSQADVDFAFLDTVSNSSKSNWMVMLLLGEKPVEFKIDTGAAVTAITEETYEAIQRPSLTPSLKTLCGPADQNLKVLGLFTGQLTFQENMVQGELYVVKGLKSNLLGLPSITDLHLVERLCTTEMEGGDIRKHFPQVFTGLGTFGEEYQIKLKDNATPYALYAPRNVPIPLCPKVREELNRMERMGVIQKVSEPTPWCAGMVVVPKKSGAIRICVDLKPLNENVLREVYPIPKVDDILAQLTGANIFSKLMLTVDFGKSPCPSSRDHSLHS